MALCKRLVQSGAHLFKLRLLDATHKSSFFTPGKFEHSRNISELVRSNTPKRAFLVDTLALVRVLESHQVPSKQAETITTAIVAVLNDSLESLSHSCVSKEEMQKSAMIQDSSLSKFKVEVQSSQDHHSSMLEREIENRKADLDKVNEKLQYEIDKGIAGQRLDLNLERGRTRDELANQKAETTNLTNKSDREIHALRAQVEAAKYEIIKYCIGTLVSISAVGLAVIRILM
ncbi:Coiled-coil domain-containing protein 90B, mitochondrial [Linum perenne]